MIPPYPLAWPEGLPRTERRQTAQFRTSLSGALTNVRDSLRLFGQDTGKPVGNIVLSSNVVGLGDIAISDPGVAAWFDWDGAQRSIAVDRYAKVEWNLQAIHHIIEARRVEFRHGGLHIIRQTFKGFTALPAPAGEQEWWRVLGLNPGATLEQIEAAYRLAAKSAHPDAGGSADEMARLNRAVEQARKARSLIRVGT